MSDSLSVQEKKLKIDFKDGGHGGNLGFMIGKILAIFDVQVNPMHPTKFQDNWPFGSGEEAKHRFSRWPPLRPSALWIKTILTIFDLQVTRYFLLSFKPIGLLEHEKKRKINFQDGRDCGHLGFPIGIILAIFDLQVTPMLPTELQVNWPFC